MSKKIQRVLELYREDEPNVQELEQIKEIDKFLIETEGK